MARKTSILILLFILADFVSKFLAKSFGIAHINKAFIGGFFEWPEMYMTVILSLALILSAIYYWRQKKPFIGETIFFCGVWSSGLERLIMGQTIDFIKLPLGFKVFYFNFADLYLWLGFFLILFQMIKKKKGVPMFSILLSLLSMNLMAQQSITATVDITGGSFQANSTSVKGSVEKIGNTLKAKNIVVDVRSLKTTMELRDSHLHEKLEAEKFPYISLKEASAGNGQGKGILSIKGQELPVDFKTEEKEIDGAKMVVVKFAIDLEKIKISDLSYLGIGVKNIVNIEAILPLKLASQGQAIKK